MTQALKFILYMLFISSIVTGVKVLIGGAVAIPGATTTLVEATIDNEVRYFSVFWLAYGMFCFWVARDIVNRHHFLPAIASVLFMGGIARLSSIVLVGMPGKVLLNAMIPELVLPLVIYFFYQRKKATFAQLQE